MIPRFSLSPALTVTPTLLILDRDDRILCISPCATAKLNCAVGDDFFARFALDARDRAALETCRQNLNGNTLLSVGKSGPLLLFNQLFAVAGLTVVVLPEGEERRLLEHPAAYFEILPQLTLAPSAMLRHEPATEQGYALLSEYLGRLCRPFIFNESYNSPLRDPLDRLALRIITLAKLFDCTADCELHHLSYHSLENYQAELALGAMAVILAAAKRTVGKCALRVDGVLHDSAGPALTVTLPTPDAPHELLAYMKQSQACGRYFDVSQEDSCTRITLALCISELSAQGVKSHDFPENHVEIPLSLIDLEQKPEPLQEGGISLFHNGQWAPGAADSERHRSQQEKKAKAKPSAGITLETLLKAHNKK